MSHGPLFDEFHASSGEHHGGAQHDEFHGGPRANAGTDAVTHTYRKPTAGRGKHGQLWDEFGWKQMPEEHGRHFDADFRSPTAMDGSAGHGTWHDVFTEGTQVRAVANGGHDLEATVIRCHDDHVVARDRSGREVELGIFQLKEWRRADRAGAPERTGIKSATPGHTDAPQKASPSASSPSAGAAVLGGQRESIDVDAATGSVFANKTAVEVLADVRKLAGLEG